MNITTDPITTLPDKSVAAIVALRPGNLFGWVNGLGLRRYRRCLLFTARKSGKTELAGAIANYLLFCDSEPSPEIVSAAGNAEQAEKVFKAAAAMVLAEPELSSRANVLFHICLLFAYRANRILGRYIRSLEISCSCEKRLMRYDRQLLVGKHLCPRCP